MDYRFVGLEDFLRMAEDGEFLEFKEVHGNHYATPLRSMEALLAEGQIAVLKIDVQGAREAIPKRSDAVPIFLLPPNDAELERRMRGRGTESEESVQLRLANAREEIAWSAAYPHRIVNDDVLATVRRIMEIVG